ncbi:TPA: hypothetical protein ACGOPI_000975 [Streptococcus suis]
MEVYSFFVILFATIILFVFSFNVVKKEDKSLKIKILIICGMFYLYSGFGISNLSNPWSYAGKYIIYLLTLLITIITVTKKQASGKEGLIDRVSNVFSNLFKVFAIIHILSILFQLIYPDFLLFKALNPISILLDGDKASQVFINRVERTSNIILNINGYVKTLTLPFLYIFLYKKYGNSSKKIFAVIGILTYLQIAGRGQWGRATLLIPFVFLFVYLYKQNKIKFRHLLIIGFIGSIILIPFMNAIAVWRQTGDFAIYGNGFMASLAKFSTSEFSYPNFYDVSLYLNQNSENAFKYLAWLFTLPIPSSILGTNYLVSKTLSEYVLGVPYASSGFYIILPSWLGEGLITFGDNFYWINALIVGLVIGLMHRIIRNNKVLKVYDVYFIWLLISYLRSVSQEFIAQAIQTQWLLLMIIIIYYIVPKRRIGSTN